VPLGPTDRAFSARADSGKPALETLTKLMVAVASFCGEMRRTNARAKKGGKGSNKVKLKVVKKVCTTKVTSNSASLSQLESSHRIDGRDEA